MPIKIKLKFQRIFDETIKLIKRHKLVPSPENYRLWFDYTAGLNKDLKSEIDQLIDDRVRITDTVCKKLYTLHIENKDAKQLDATNTAIRQMLGVMIDNLKSWDQSATKFNDALVKCTLRLESDPDVDEMKNIITTMTADMLEVNTAQRSVQSTMLSLNDEILDLRHDVERLGNEVLTDPLTKVANRRAFDIALNKHVNSPLRNSQQLTLIMADIDFFKRINDEFGHPVGDKILRFISSLMQKNIRINDYLYRYGGEEFAVILPDTNTEGAVQLAEHLRIAVSSKQLTTGIDGQMIGRVTMSLGVATLRDNENTDAFIDRADKQLYRAKKSGRDKVCADTD